MHAYSAYFDMEKHKENHVYGWYLAIMGKQANKPLTKTDNPSS